MTAKKRSNAKTNFDIYQLDHAITEEFKQFNGQPEALHNKLEVVKKYNPFLFLFQVNPTQGEQHEYTK
jgi:hypothetical protein